MSMITRKMNFNMESGWAFQAHNVVWNTIIQTVGAHAHEGGLMVMGVMRVQVWITKF